MLSCHLPALPNNSQTKSTLSDVGMEGKEGEESMRNWQPYNGLVIFWIVGLLLCIIIFVLLHFAFDERKTVPDYSKNIPVGPVKVRVNCEFYVLGPCFLRLEAQKYNLQTLQLFEGDRIRFSTEPIPPIPKPR
jgi:hypothetical protein